MEILYEHSKKVVLEKVPSANKKKQLLDEIEALTSQTEKEKKDPDLKDLEKAVSEKY